MFLWKWGQVFAVLWWPFTFSSLCTVRAHGVCFQGLNSHLTELLVGHFPQKRLSREQALHLQLCSKSRCDLTVDSIPLLNFSLFTVSNIQASTWSHLLSFFKTGRGWSFLDGCKLTVRFYVFVFKDVFHWHRHGTVFQGSFCQRCYCFSLVLLRTWGWWGCSSSQNLCVILFYAMGNHPTDALSFDLPMRCFVFCDLLTFSVRFAFL